ncbi:hypothetical protein KO489_00350 [Reinekea forsetii]|nr:hypothetical protein [Reinekea forsetii]
MSLRILKKKHTQLAFLLIAVVASLTSCQWENSTQTSLNVSVGYQSESARFADRASISSVYPSIGTIWVSIETPTLNVVQINEQYNNGQLTLNTAKSAIKITDTNVSLNVPTDETLTVSIEAFNIANLKVFSGSTEVAPEELGGASVQVNVPIQADIDASVDILASLSQCQDDDGDGYCNIFEDLFVNANGLPDIDNDGRYNSNDIDSDNDGVPDNVDRNESSLVSGYTVSNNGFPMFLVPNTRPTIQNFTLSVIDTSLHTIELPLSSVVDSDVNDEITYWVAGNLPLGVSARTIGNTLEYQYTGVLLSSLLSHTIQIEAYDIAALSLIESENPPGPVTFEVKVEVLPGVGIMF